MWSLSWQGWSDPDHDFEVVLNVVGLGWLLVKSRLSVCQIDLIKMGEFFFVIISLLLFLIDVVVEEFDDQVHMRQYHPSAAVAFAAKLVQCLTSGDALLINQVQVFVPFVAHHLNSNGYSACFHLPCRR